ncbi:Gcd10p family-domain-containing protein [Scheffersomyces coipomensis]|uniref:Gcd10p family-domain-containing protein n=1 Tax=Scheffersomyces coipomensis TaxID=1788519 RepID=UPI00315D3A28
MSSDIEVKPVKNEKVISFNQHVLIRLPSEGVKIAYLKEEGIINLGKFGSFQASGVVGYNFGQSFEIIEDENVNPISFIGEVADASEREDTPELSKDELTMMFSNSAENNQNIINIGSKVQQLSNADIDELKKSGASSNIGQQIIEKMISGHGGFDKKTIFSQQKYLKRKQQKFLRRFTVEYIGSSELLEYFIVKDLPRVHGISEETLGSILSYGNIRPGGNYLVIDETGGVVIYAMLERMKGEGSMVVVHENEHVNFSALKYADYPEDLQNEMVKTINWLQFLEPENEKILWEDVDDEEFANMKTSKKAQYERRSKRANYINSVIEVAKKGNFDALICVSTLHLPTLLPEILPKIGGSRPIVVYSQFKELLLDTQHCMMSDKRVLAPSIIETRVRKYQTIPGRLHPLMTSRGYGGYILWGTRVIPQESGITAVGRGITKKRKENPESTPTQEADTTETDTPETTTAS